MATDTNTNPGEGQEQTALSPETQRLAELGRGGDTAPPEFRPELAGKQRPDNVPEKFWDREKGVVNQDALLKSYLELERSRGQTPPSADQTPEGKPAIIPNADQKPPEGEPPAEGGEEKTSEEAPKGDEEKPPEGDAATAAVTSAITAAQEDYAKNGGELSEDAVKGLLAAGIQQQQIDLYIQGVKAQERALAATAEEAAGDKATLDAAMEYAGTLSQEEIDHLNAGLANPKTLARTVKGLVADYRAANPQAPGEGRLTNTTGSTNFGDVYTSKEEYLKDMETADRTGDGVARTKAIQKLQRSKKAGTVKEVTPRSGPFAR